MDEGTTAGPRETWVFEEGGGATAGPTIETLEPEDGDDSEVVTDETGVLKEGDTRCSEGP